MSRSHIAVLLGLVVVLHPVAIVGDQPPARLRPAEKKDDVEATVRFLAQAIQPDQAAIDYLAQINLSTGMPLRPGESTALFSDRHGRDLAPNALAILDAWEASHIVASADGRTIVVAHSHCPPLIHLADRFTGRGYSRLWEGGQVSGLALSPDGTQLAAAVCRYTSNRGTQGRVFLWDLRRRLIRDDCVLITPATAVAFTPDGAGLVVGDEEGVVSLWSTVNGKRVRELGTHEREVLSVAVAADGKTAASASPDGTVRFWDIARGRERRCLKLGGPTRCVALSPDGRLAAFVVGPESSLGDTHVWDVAAGVELKHFAHRPPSARNVGFSPDGRLLATVERGGVQVWEVATGQERLKLCHAPDQSSSRLASLAFFPDGRGLVAGGGPGSSWDLTGRSPAGQLLPARFTAVGFDSLWHDLGQRDPATAHAAVWAFVAAGDAGVAELAERLPAVAAVGAERLGKLLAALDKGAAERQQALTDLESLDDVRVVPELVKVRAGPAAMEIKDEVEPALVRVTGPIGGERLRAWRALEALEHINTPAASAVLAKLAQGPPHAHVTRAAQEALGRLEKR